MPADPRRPESPPVSAEPSESAATGARLIDLARGLVGSHYLPGAAGATPGGHDGAPGQPGGVRLIADPRRLNPARQTDSTRDLAVLAAQTAIGRHAVCGGNYKSFGGARTAAPRDPDLTHYLTTLQGQPPGTWRPYLVYYTARRVHGPTPGGDPGGILVWGQACTGIRHFDGPGFIRYCFWRATGRDLSFDSAWWLSADPPLACTEVYDLRAGHSPHHLRDADLLVRADGHLAWVTASGTLIEAAGPAVGVVATGRFNLAKPSGVWSYLVRLPL